MTIGNFNQISEIAKDMERVKEVSPKIETNQDFKDLFSDDFDMTDLKDKESDNIESDQAENYDDILSELLGDGDIPDIKKQERGDIQGSDGKDIYRDMFADDFEADNCEKSISNKDELKDLSPELRETKPEHSPALDRWIEEGGQIKIKVTDGKPEWIYINAEGIEVKYDEDGYPIFPDEVKHPDIPDINIGSFTGDREKDKRLYIKELEEYGLTDIPEGYVLHHDSKNGNLQLIKKEYHEQFTHKGGHSKYKEGAD